MRFAREPESFLNCDCGSAGVRFRYLPLTHDAAVHFPQYVASFAQAKTPFSHTAPWRFSISAASAFAVNRCRHAWLRVLKARLGAL
jgi:hypothetical protein